MSDKRVVVSVTDLVMRYGSKTAVNGISFDVHQGEVVAILGPNGSGKTTTMEILEGFRIPSSGDVKVFGIEPWDGDERWRSKMGIVLQSWQDHPRWTTRRILEHCSRYYPVDGCGQINHGLVAEVTEFLSLNAFIDRPLGRLSGGERRRVDVALAMLGSPEIIFMDEPTAGLDPRARHEFHELVSFLARERGIAILVTTHDLDEVEQIADRLLTISRGQVVAHGTLEEIKRRSGGEVTVTWVESGEKHVEQAGAGYLALARQLLADPKNRDIDHLEIRHGSLEDSYLRIMAAQAAEQEERVS